ncbi:class I mannose-6-phosphate isomerase [Pedobacter sp. GSP4]|uniref:class I mannose-6-phosphate isomerase n=1 Tax=Pedobacter sp. GSP4 TaxID=3453716 RepID=UPI003EEBF002
MNIITHSDTDQSIRHSQQKVLPIHMCSTHSDKYDQYPLQEIHSGGIFTGYESFCNYISGYNSVRIDGFSGVLWNEIIVDLDKYLKTRGRQVRWTFTEDFYKEHLTLEQLRAPFLGEAEDVWGRQADISLADFFKLDEVDNCQPLADGALDICIGCGAALFDWDGPLIFLEVPKNEIQYRMRAGAVQNLGSKAKVPYQQMYKSLYFIDWVVLKKHREHYFNAISVIADTQWLGDISWMYTADLKQAAHDLTGAPLRARPWFEKGVWGGQFLKEFVPGISQDESNYAWSFELIVPENGIVLHKDGNNFEIPFDLLMHLESERILGSHQKIFGTEFPIRFDFLDTIQGGDLSVQVHPEPAYIRTNFGENFTQDETYYILEAEADASVYLGLQDGVEKDDFKKAAQQSYSNNSPLDVEAYVQRFPAKKHDLFLIPHGTVHSAGQGNLVLEISATPYIFTFKIYDWLRPDLDGKPRPISIDHAFENIDFSAAGDRVEQEYIAKPKVSRSGQDWEIVNFPTHDKHFYEINQLSIASELAFAATNVCKIMMVVEGNGVTVVSEDGLCREFSYAETFILPSAMGSYKLIATDKKPIKVIEAYLKAEHIVFDLLLTDKKKQYGDQ